MGENSPAAIEPEDTLTSRAQLRDPFGMEPRPNNLDKPGIPFFALFK